MKTGHGDEERGANYCFSPSPRKSISGSMPTISPLTPSLQCGVLGSGGGSSASGDPHHCHTASSRGCHRPSLSQSASPLPPTGFLLREALPSSDTSTASTANPFGGGAEDSEDEAGRGEQRLSDVGGRTTDHVGRRCQRRRRSLFASTSPASQSPSRMRATEGADDYDNNRREKENSSSGASNERARRKSSSTSSTSRTLSRGMPRPQRRSPSVVDETALPTTRSGRRTDRRDDGVAGERCEGSAEMTKDGESSRPALGVPPLYFNPSPRHRRQQQKQQRVARAASTPPASLACAGHAVHRVQLGKEPNGPSVSSSAPSYPSERSHRTCSSDDTAVQRAAERRRAKERSKLRREREEGRPPIRLAHRAVTATPSHSPSSQRRQGGQAWSAHQGASDADGNSCHKVRSPQKPLASEHSEGAGPTSPHVLFLTPEKSQKSAVGGQSTPSQSSFSFDTNASSSDSPSDATFYSTPSCRSSARSSEDVLCSTFSSCTRLCGKHNDTGDSVSGDSGSANCDEDGLSCSSLDLCSCCRGQVARLESNYKLMVVRLLKEMASLEQKQDEEKMRKQSEQTRKVLERGLLKGFSNHGRHQFDAEDWEPSSTTKQTIPSLRTSTREKKKPPFSSPMKSQHELSASSRVSGATTETVPFSVPPPTTSAPPADAEQRPIVLPSSTAFPAFPLSPAAPELVTVQLALAALAHEVQATKLALRHHVLAQGERDGQREGNQSIGNGVGNAQGVRQGYGNHPAPVSSDGKGIKEAIDIVAGARCRGSGSTDNEYRRADVPSHVGKPPTVPTSTSHDSAASQRWQQQQQQQQQHQQGHRYNESSGDMAPQQVGGNAVSAAKSAREGGGSSSNSQPGPFTASHSSPDPIPPPPLSPLVDFLLSSLSPSAYAAAYPQAGSKHASKNPTSYQSAPHNPLDVPAGEASVGQPRLTSFTDRRRCERKDERAVEGEVTMAEQGRGRTSSGSGSAGVATTVHTYSHARASPSPSPSHPFTTSLQQQDPQAGRHDSDQLAVHDTDSPRATSNSRPSGSTNRSVRTQPSPSPSSPYTGDGPQRGVRVSFPVPTAHHPVGGGAADAQIETGWNRRRGMPEEMPEDTAEKENRAPHTHPGGQSNINTDHNAAARMGYVEGNSPEEKLHTRTFSLSPGDASVAKLFANNFDDGEDGEARHTKAALRERADAPKELSYGAAVGTRSGAAADVLRGLPGKTATPTYGDNASKLALKSDEESIVKQSSRSKYVYELSPEEIAASKRGRTRREQRKSFGGRSETASTVPASPLSSSEEAALLLSLIYPSSLYPDHKRNMSKHTRHGRHRRSRSCPCEAPQTYTVERVPVCRNPRESDPSLGSEGQRGRWHDDGDETGETIPVESPWQHPLPRQAKPTKGPGRSAMRNAQATPPPSHPTSLDHTFEGSADDRLRSQNKTRTP